MTVSPRAVVRRATVADAAALAALDAICFDIPWDERSVLTMLAGDLTRGWRLDVGGTLVAAALVRVVAAEGEVLRIGVAPSYRRRGLARALMAEVLGQLEPEMRHGIHLEVRASNLAAQALYKSLAFVVSGGRQAYYTAPVEDAVLMTWTPLRGAVAP